MEYTFQFLRDLKANNTRNWFEKNRERYEISREEMINFANQLLEEIKKFDVPETSTGKKSLNRIYRDIRFKKDKTPYKDHWGGGIYRAGAERRGSYYYHISPERSYILAGFFGPNPQDLLHIRNQIEQDPAFLREIIESSAFKKDFGSLQGKQLKTAPRGFAKDHPEIDLLRYKQFYLLRDFTEKEVLSAQFPQIAADYYHRMLPFLTRMTEMLTTDLNGIPLL